MQAKKPLTRTPVRFIKGVGPARSSLFEKLGIRTVSDLFFYRPRRYEDRRDIVDITRLELGKRQGFVAKVLKTSLFTAKTGTRIFELALGPPTPGSGAARRVFAVWYNQPYMKKLFSQGTTALFFGLCENQGRLVITHPAFEILDENNSGKISDSLEIGRVIPVYPLTENLTQKYMRKIVHEAIHLYVSGASENLPTRVRAHHKLVDIAFAVENIHFPRSFDNLEKAYKRFIFEEFFILEAIMAIRRKAARAKGIEYRLDENLLSDFEKLFPFQLTDGQKKCIAEISRDMSEKRAMHRLLQGDVGSGKTVVAMFALLLAVKNGFQAVLMAPTEVLASQHFVTVSRHFMPLGLDVRLLVGGSENKDVQDADIIIGTHALIQESISYRKLGLVVIDEEHKFGVDQRKNLFAKSGAAGGPAVARPDTLIMTATPIPRSLALTIYGDMDISFLKEKPFALREAVSTFWAGEEEREIIYAFIAEEIKKGRQAFIVYPRIKETSSSNLKSAEKMYQHLKKDIFRGLRLELIHGRMSQEEKDRIMKNFTAGKIDVLISTTIIEVGVDIPNASVMLIEHAERYGLSQLHQLRGRIGRGRHASYCVLMGDANTENARERLSTICQTDDGFVISEKDMDLRGPGEILGTRQSGLAELKFGDITRDIKIMEEARADAFQLIEEDPNLADSRNFGLRQVVRERTDANHWWQVQKPQNKTA